MMEKLSREEVRANILIVLKKKPNGVRLRYLPCRRMEGLSILEELEAQGIVERIDVRKPEKMEWYYLWKIKNKG